MSMRSKFGRLFPIVMLVFGMAFGVTLSNSGHPAYGQGSLDSESQLFRTIYSQANPSVVSIDVRIPGGSATFGSPSNRQGATPYQYAAGSGFVFDTVGHIVTNAHVVAGTDRVEVTFSDDTIMHAKIIGIDLDSDIAVIQVEGNASQYHPLSLANSDAVVVGDRVAAIGNPFQEAGTLTQGVVSGIHRPVLGLAPSTSGGSYRIPDAIQTDAALNPGNSGGPLLNTQGQVIGVNEQIDSQVRQSSGVSFAIPANLVNLVANALIKDGRIQHPWLGIGGNSLDLDTNEAIHLPSNTRGAYISSVQPGSPAAKAGLKAGTSTINVNGVDVPVGGDVIVAIDKQPIKHFDDLTSYLFTKVQVGQTVTLTILRNGQQQDVPLTLAARPQTQQQ